MRETYPLSLKNPKPANVRSLLQVLREELAAKIQENERLHVQSFDERKEHQQQRELLQEQVRHLQERLEAREAEKGALEEEALRRTSQLQRRLGELEAEGSSLRTQLANSESELRAFQNRRVHGVAVYVFRCRSLLSGLSEEEARLPCAFPIACGSSLGFCRAAAERRQLATLARQEHTRQRRRIEALASLVELDPTRMPLLRVCNATNGGGFPNLAASQSLREALRQAGASALLDASNFLAAWPAALEVSSQETGDAEGRLMAPRGASAIYAKLEAASLQASKQSTIRNTQPTASLGGGAEVVS